MIIIVSFDVHFKVLSLSYHYSRTSLRIEPSIITKCCVAILVAHVSIKHAIIRCMQERSCIDVREGLSLLRESRFDCTSFVGVSKESV